MQPTPRSTRMVTTWRQSRRTAAAATNAQHTTRHAVVDTRPARRGSGRRRGVGGTAQRADTHDEPLQSSGHDDTPANRHSGAREGHTPTSHGESPKAAPPPDFLTHTMANPFAAELIATAVSWCPPLCCTHAGPLAAASLCPLHSPRPSSRLTSCFADRHFKPVDGRSHPPSRCERRAAVGVACHACDCVSTACPRPHGSAALRDAARR
jgi:hypothetical protein